MAVLGSTTHQDLPWLVRRAAAVVLAVGAAVLLGWLLGITFLTEVVPGYSSMKLNTAVGLILLAASLLVRHHAVALVAAGVNLAMGVLTVLEYVLNRALGIKHLFFLDLRPNASFLGAMALSTGVCLVCLAVSRALLTTRPRWAEATALFAIGLAFLAILGYVYGVESLYAVAEYSTMAIQTAVAVLALSVAMLAAVPDGRLTWIMRGTDPGAMLMRRMLPIGLVTIPSAGFMVLVAERVGLFDREYAVSILVGSAALIVLAVAYQSSRALRQAGIRRNQTLDELQALNHNLESQVEERSAMLVRERTKVALLADRERIADDVHDRVIQRFFASGLMLKKLERTITDPAARQVVADVITELDGATADIREIIFELKLHISDQGLEGSLNETALRSRRILGFLPTVIVDADLNRLAPLTGEVVLAVVGEALTNVARHADATAVEVRLESTAGWLRLVVTDDGKGMPESMPHESGTESIRRRAALLGGHASWDTPPSGGVRLVWLVPLTHQTELFDDAWTQELPSSSGPTMVSQAGSHVSREKAGQGRHRG